MAVLTRRTGILVQKAAQGPDPEFPDGHPHFVIRDIDGSHQPREIGVIFPRTLWKLAADSIGCHMQVEGEYLQSHGAIKIRVHILTLSMLPDTASIGQEPEVKRKKVALPPQPRDSAPSGQVGKRVFGSRHWRPGGA